MWGGVGGRLGGSARVEPWGRLGETPAWAPSTLGQSARTSAPTPGVRSAHLSRPAGPPSPYRAASVPSSTCRLTHCLTCLHDCRLGLLGLLSLALGPGAVPELGRAAWSAGLVLALAVYLASMARILLD